MQTSPASAHKPRIVFYLPVVTPWWFTTIVVPLIRAATRGGEVHVLVPPLWSSTGIRAEELEACADLDVSWHILDYPDHSELRFSQMRPEIVELVRQIDPDLCLCRSADIETPSAFPGIVRYIMEAAANPFATPYFNVQLCERLFDHGMMPAIGAARGQWLEDRLAHQWATKLAELPGMDRGEFLRRLGIAEDKILIGLPLEFEHDEVFWSQHGLHETNADLIGAIADRLDDDTMLLATHHPINQRHPLPSSVAVELEALKRHDKVRIVQDIAGPGTATNLMLRHCDGMIVGHSKTFTTGAFLGKPMLHMSRFDVADWLGAYTDLQDFVAALRSGTARAPTKADALRWFAFHHANTVIDPLSPELDLECLIDHAVNVVRPERWERGLARYFGIDPRALPPMPADNELPARCAA